MYIKTTEKTIIYKYTNILVTVKGFRLRYDQEHEEQLKIANRLIEALQKNITCNKIIYQSKAIIMVKFIPVPYKKLKMICSIHFNLF